MEESFKGLPSFGHRACDRTENKSVQNPCSAGHRLSDNQEFAFRAGPLAGSVSEKKDPNEASELTPAERDPAVKAPHSKSAKGRADIARMIDWGSRLIAAPFRVPNGRWQTTHAATKTALPPQRRSSLSAPLARSGLC
jgi:hypothetical protein